MHGPHIPQERKLVTAVPGPKSQELVRRRGEAVSAGLGMAVPVEGAKVILNALLMTFAGKKYPSIDSSNGFYPHQTL